jgi:hypothetical protein
MIANISAFALARHWRPIPIYEALLLQDGIHLPHGNQRPEPRSVVKSPAPELPVSANL